MGRAAIASKYQWFDERGLGLPALRGGQGLDHPALPDEIDFEQTD
jgi:hypothetical protein